MINESTELTVCIWKKKEMHAVVKECSQKRH